MRSSILNELISDQFATLVVGQGVYADALASVLGTSAMPFKQLEGDLVLDSEEGCIASLASLRHVLMVIPENMSVAEVLQYHLAVRCVIEKLSRAKDQHDLAFVFVLPPSAGKSYEEALAAGLGLPKLDPATTGHAVWNRAGSLSELLKVIENIQPRDLMWLRACWTADGKRKALAQLRSLPADAQPATIQTVAKLVLDEFRDRQYLLDVYCHPPSHQNGNELRKWLWTAVTGPVTQDWWEGTRRNLDQWLNGEGL